MTITLHNGFDLTTDQSELIKKTMDYERASLSPNTLRSYKSMWNKFKNWCISADQLYLPSSAETIALYISSIADTVSFSTLDSTLAAIESAHEKSNYSINGDISLYRRVRKGIRRTHKYNQSLKKAKALTIMNLKGVCCKLGNSISDIRNRAILTLCFFGAFRRSELVSLNVEDCIFNKDGMTVHVLQSKTSDTVTKKYLSYAVDKDICPISSVNTWLQVANINQGPIFYSLLKNGKLSSRLSGHAVSEILKKYFGDAYSGHSPRRGLLTESARKNIPFHLMKQYSGHKSFDMLMSYIDDIKGFEYSSVKTLGA